jgi:hypothetical protein
MAEEKEKIEKDQASKPGAPAVEDELSEADLEKISGGDTSCTEHNATCCGVQYAK